MTNWTWLEEIEKHWIDGILIEISQEPQIIKDMKRLIYAVKVMKKGLMESPCDCTTGLTSGSKCSACEALEQAAKGEG